MTATLNPFERRARRLRRTLRRHRMLERIANALGIPLWRWYLRHRLGAGIEFPAMVEIDLATVPFVLPADLAGRANGAVRGGRWDRRVVSRAAVGTATDGGKAPVAVAFDHRGRPMFVGSAPVLPAGAKGRRVPARVVLRHRRWARLAREVRAYAAQRGGTAYQPYLHPDLADIPSDQGHERFDLLLASLPSREGTLIDLGANSGYFSHRFEEAGFNCIAVERSEKEAYFLRALRHAAGLRFRIRKGSVTEVELPKRPDVVLALNIFHHFLKTEAGVVELTAFLERLEPRLLLFESHLPDDPQMARAHRNLEPLAFAEWVRSASGLRTARQIGCAADGRPLFLLS